MTFNLTIDGPMIMTVIFISVATLALYAAFKEFRRHKRDMSLIDQTANERRKLLDFMYMKSLPEDLAQKLKDEFNAVDWESHQNWLKNNGSARHLYPTFVKTYEWILK